MLASLGDIGNDVVLSDIHVMIIDQILSKSTSRPYQVAQTKSAWRAQTTLRLHARVVVITYY